MMYVCMLHHLVWLPTGQTILLPIYSGFIVSFIIWRRQLVPQNLATVFTTTWYHVMRDSIRSDEKVKTFSHMFILFYRNMFQHLWKAVIRQCKIKSIKKYYLYTSHWNCSIIMHWIWKINPSVIEGYTEGMVNFKILFIHSFIHSLYFLYIPIQVKYKGCGNC